MIGVRFSDRANAERPMRRTEVSQLDAEAHGLAFAPAGADPVLVPAEDWDAAAGPGPVRVAPRLDNEYCLPFWKEKQL